MKKKGIPRVGRKAKDKVVLSHVGYRCKGDAELYLWGGGVGAVEMSTWFIPDGKMTKANLLQGVNDGGFGCEGLKSAEIDIYDVYGTTHSIELYNRGFKITWKPHLDYAMRGI